LTVSDIAGEVRVIEVDENETVAHVKAVLEVEFAVPQSAQLLFFETKKLENHQRLNAAGVKNDDMLMMQAVRDDGLALGGIGGPDSMRLNADPFNVAAQKQIEEMVRMQNVNANLDQVELFSFSHRVKFPVFVFKPTEMRGKEMQAMEHNPEAFASVVMLYVDCEVNGFPVKAFVDSGAQVTIMSQPTAQRLGLMRLIDYSLSHPVLLATLHRVSPFSTHDILLNFSEALIFPLARASSLSIAFCVAKVHCDEKER
jgi:hypothetical protein